ncbi:MAG: SDR family NAD(P)-dependent oxidoreductase [Actinomycetota bacterium]
MRLEGKVALITGGTSGIGAATAQLFAQEGAAVAITGRHVGRGELVATRVLEAGGSCRFLEADVRVAAECERAVAETVDAFGRLDVLFNNAGIYVANDALGCSEDEWDAQVDTSLKGAFLMSRAAIPHMVAHGSGTIVNCASGWGLVGGAKAVAYCAAKGGMVAMTKAMAIDHGGQGIRVNAVCPGDTETPMEREDARNQGLTWEEYVRIAGEGRPIPRMGEPIEVARAVLFLASDEASFVTGVALPVDGGGVAG